MGDKEAGRLLKSDLMDGWSARRSSCEKVFCVCSRVLIPESLLEVGRVASLVSLLGFLGLRIKVGQIVTQKLLYPLPDSFQESTLKKRRDEKRKSLKKKQSEPGPHQVA